MDKLLNFFTQRFLTAARVEAAAWTLREPSELFQQMLAETHPLWWLSDLNRSMAYDVPLSPKLMQVHKFFTKEEAMQHVEVVTTRAGLMHCVCFWRKAPKP